MLSERVDPELASCLDTLSPLNLWDDLPAFRERLAQWAAQRAETHPVIENVISGDDTVRVDDQNTVRVRVYRPDKLDEPLPALIWLHGGGYCVGSLDQDDDWVRRLVQAVGCAVVSVDYRLAPEQPFPAALDDSYAALEWAHTHASELAFDKGRLAVGGMSAGAGLAAGLALAARDRGNVPLIFQLLCCPMLDDRNSTPSSYSITDTRVWNRQSNLCGWAAYLGSHLESSVTSVYAAAARATDLSGLPPVYMRVGSEDLFVDENCDYAARLTAARVPTDFAVIPGAFHGFEVIAPGANISKVTVNGYYIALRRALFADELSSSR